jgi:hypothetical protein
VPGHDVDLVDLNLSVQCHGWSLGKQPTAQLLRHELHVGGIQIELRANLPVREVQPHEVEAQYPYPQRLMMTGQHRAGEIVEAARTDFAPVTLAMRLCVIAPVANNRTVAASRAANAIGPAMLTHQREALGVIQQR